MTRLHIRGLHASFGPLKVLQGLDLDVATDSTVSVLGPSGCGKTTLLRCIAGLQPHEEGTIFLDGRDLTTLPAEKRDVVLLHQENTLFPHLTVEENVAFGLKVRGIGRAERHAAANEMLSRLGLEGLGARRVDQLSGGQQQRVMLARALAVKPKMLLLDEPLSSLDRPLRLRLREELRETLRRLGIPVLFVTHDQEEAAWLSDHIVLMDEGRIVDQGTAERLHSRPRGSHAARLLGRQNFLPYRRTGPAQCSTGLGTLPLATDAPTSGLLMVREERIELAPAGKGPIACEVTDARFMGDHYLILVTAHDVPLRIRAPVHPTPPTSGTASLRLPEKAVTALAE